MVPVISQQCSSCNHVSDHSNLRRFHQSFPPKPLLSHHIQAHLHQRCLHLDAYKQGPAHKADAAVHQFRALVVQQQQQNTDYASSVTKLTKRFTGSRSQ